MKAGMVALGSGAVSTAGHSAVDGTTEFAIVGTDLSITFTDVSVGTVTQHATRHRFASTSPRRHNKHR